MRSFALCAFAAGLTMFAVGVAFHFVLVPVFAPGIPPRFLNAHLFRPLAGWVEVYLALHPFGYGVLFAAAYHWLRTRAAFPQGPRAGLGYGFGVFLVGSFPIYVLNYASFQITADVIVSWELHSLAQYTAAGAVLAAVHHARFDPAAGDPPPPRTP